MNAPNRKLSADEERLLRHMLEQGDDVGKGYDSQVDRVEVTPWRCDCGCASLQFAVDGKTQPDGSSFEPLGHFTFGSDEEMCGIFVFAQSGVLGGIEVYGMGCDPPNVLPSPESLRGVPT